MAKKNKLQDLNKQYEFICNEIIIKFCKKQKIDFDGWVGNEIGGVASFSCQYYFNFSDIILDLNTKQPKWKILDWQSEDIEYNLFNKQPQHINYKSYIMGLRIKQLK